MNSELFQHLRVTSRQVLGAFYPHAYSIGIAGIADANRFQAYPLPPDNPTETSNFYNNVVFFHEFVHLSQYICTSFGLEMARLTNICQNVLLQQGPWKPPILANYKEMDANQLIRLVSYLYVVESMTIRMATLARGSVEVPSSISLASRPSSPALGFIEDEYPSLHQAAEFIKNCSWSVHCQPHLLTTRADGNIDDIALNTGALFEGFAHLTEVNHIANALALDEEGLRPLLLGYPPIYLAAFITYRFIFELPYERFTTHLAALIDIALMYSPQLIHNVFPTEREYRLPAEIFLDVCTAARSVMPIQDHSYEEAQRYQDDVCSKMKIPTANEMVDLCLERLARIGIDNKKTYNQWIDDQNPISSRRMFGLHWLGMSFRKRHALGYYAKMIKTDWIIELYEESRGAFTQFDLHEKKPINLRPSQLSQLCMHGMIWDSLYKKRLNCPLKAGHPFYCALADSDENQLCVFVAQDGSNRVLGECPLDIFERALMARSR